MNEQDLREAMRTEMGNLETSPIVEEKLRAAYEQVRTAPQAKAGGRRYRQTEKIWLKPLKAAAGALGTLAAAFVILVGVSAANPALAAAIPGMESIIGFFSRQEYGLATQGGVEQYLQPVDSQPGQTAAETVQRGLQVKESYYDGEVLILGVQVTFPDAPKEYRELYGEYNLQFTDGEKVLSPAYQVARESEDSVFQRISEDTYVSQLILYPKEGNQLDLPDHFTMTVGFENFKALDPLHMVLAPGTDPEERVYISQEYPLELPETAEVSVARTEELLKTYDVQETENGCTLQQVIVTPVWTEVKIDTAESDEPIIMLAYDGKGEQLEAVHAYTEKFSYQRFRALEKGETAVTIKFFKKSNARDPIAEFTVPVEGGYYEKKEKSTWLAPGETGEIVYDPPIEEGGGFAQDASIRRVEPEETFTVQGAMAGLESGTIDLTFSKPKYYSDWREAGIADEEMNFSDALLPEQYGPSEYTFVLFDLTLEAHDAVSEGSGEYEGVYWITNFADASVLPEGAEFQRLVNGNLCWASAGIQYFSEHGIGFSDYYHMTLGANEQKTVQVGYMVKTEDLNAGRFLLHAWSSDQDHTEFFERTITALNVPPQN